MIGWLLRWARAVTARGGETELPAPETGQRVFAIGDIHGRADLLRQLFAKIDAYQASRPGETAVEIILGDFIDRGPATRDVMDLIFSRRDLGHRLVVLKGNHEEMMLRFLSDPSVLKNWRKLGGYNTLLSFGVSPPAFLDAATGKACQRALRAALSPRHLEFLKSLDLSYCNGGYFFVHAGVDPSRSLEAQRPEDLLSIGGEFLAYEESFGKVIVHGHTPRSQVEFRHNRINIDTGAYATGVLTCVVLDGTAQELIQT